MTLKLKPSPELAKLPQAEQDKLMKLAARKVALELFEKKYGLASPSKAKSKTV